MIDITETAVNEFRQILAMDEHKGLGIKIKAHMAQSSSCCSCGPSQSYDMGLVEEGEAGDKTIEFDGVKIYMDDSSIEMMSASQVDFIPDQGFVVKDKNAPSCGCGGGDYSSHGGGCGDSGSHGGGSCCG